MNITIGPHAFLRSTFEQSRHGPSPDETCAVCGTDPRNIIHRQEQPMREDEIKEMAARTNREALKQAIKRLDAAHAELAIISPRRSAAVAAWDQAQAHLASASADESRARDEIAEARLALYALVDKAFEEAP